MHRRKFQDKIISQIVEKRKTIGYSQEYIAQCLGMGQANYCKIESGVRLMKIETLFKLAKILELDLNQLVGNLEMEEYMDSSL